MVLARKHIERLWCPSPARPAAIPSRAEHAIPKAQFERAMPREFWREVVDRVAAEVPGTLLLAEAFWMLEGYFVRTLGMHRVYNSAFMHMLRDEDNAGYRRVMSETLGFDPEILKRYVNFMSNPDEATAVEQFGKGDKYFGVATLMATLPGLPMLGHGQIEGFGEKYGMEFRRATLDEHPDPDLVERHQRELFPLLRRRTWFAEAADFLLYDFVTDDGPVDEQVFAYTNGNGPTRSLVLFHDRFATTTGTIRESVPVARIQGDGRKRLARRSLADGLGLANDPSAFVAFRDARTGMESLRSCLEIREQGLRMTLHAYEAHVYWEFREIHDGSAGQWARLAASLGDRPVPSLDDAMVELQLEPVHAPLRAIFEGDLVRSVLDPAQRPVDVDSLETRFARLLTAIAAATRVPGDPAAVAASIRARTERGFSVAAPTPAVRSRGPAGLAGAVTDRRAGTGRGPRGHEPRLVRRAAPRPAAGGRLSDRGSRRGRGVGRRGPRAGPARASPARPRSPAGPRPPTRGSWTPGCPTRRSRAAIGLNTWEGVEWLDRERFAGMLGWAARLDAIETDSAPDAAWAERLLAAAETAGYRVELSSRAGVGTRGHRRTQVRRSAPGRWRAPGLRARLPT